MPSLQTPTRTDFTGAKLADGRFLIRSKLGEGSMGLVFLATDQRLQTDVVVKIPTATALADPEFVERFQREMRSLVKLTHPHVVTILDVGVVDRAPYVVMQYLSGGSLRDRMLDSQGKQQPQSVNTLKDWLPSVAKALDFIHAQHYVHRDVKPANILFDQHGNAFLSDFGLAKALNDANAKQQDASLTGAGFLVGTPNYIAPEIIMGLPNDQTVDQYSLAMTVYETLVGRVPVEGPTASATMVNQTRMKIPPLSQYVPGLSPQLSEVLLRGLSKAAKQRYRTCQEFSDAVLAMITPPAKPASVAGSGGKISRGKNGRIPCPECRKILPLKPQFAGKKARCAGCLTLLQIAPDLSSLRVIGSPPPKQVDEEPLAQAPMMARSRASQKIQRDTARNYGTQKASRSSGSSDEMEALLGSEVFGIKLSTKIAAGLALTTIALMIAAAVFIGVQADAPEREQQRLKAKASVPTTRENRGRE